MQHVWLEVRGRVQGVGFRAYARRRALEHGVRGWVRNLPDGAVQLDAEGEAAPLAAFAAAVKRGPVGARVEHVEERWDMGPARYERFEIVA